MDKEQLNKIALACGRKLSKAQARVIAEYATQHDNILNIGVHKGGSAIVMGLVRQFENSGQVTCVDPWFDEEPHQIFLKTLKKYKLENFCPYHRMTSKEFFEKTDLQFPFAFIDGDHSKKGVILDIKGCIGLGTSSMLCHDWESRKHKPNAFRGIKEAVLELVDQGIVEIVKEVEYMVEIKPV